MAIPQLQTGIIQSKEPFSEVNPIAVAVSHELPLPTLTSPNHVLVRVLSVALNPSDFKMVNYFPQPGTNLPIGCDFCGVVEDASDETALVSFPRGTRVAGTLFPYGTGTCGSFAEWLVADTSQLLRVPDGLDDLHGAAIGGLCWGTCVVALFGDPEALCLPGSLTQPANKNYPVLVYGAATATGTMACQILRLAGHTPIAVTSAESGPLACSYGAVGSAAYTSPKCAEIARSLVPNGEPIRYALDCITTPESVAICFAAIGRAGGRYACLEGFKDEWRTRRAVSVKEVMGFEGFGHEVMLADSAYSREANLKLHSKGRYWASEMQVSLDRGLIKPHPVRELTGKWDGIIQGLGMLQRGEVRGQKLVVRVGLV
ncbi:putative alcohol dehydrogenase [Hypoxylon sp. FL1857]|nr:putative alcohol dehydrogenase [Hypoxylon sp. FL1857]